ncbi:hypothetical protein NQ314_010068 [Rhamnusium bicolor]|uniref:Uncharacterized protein n=1 Tax=Rhamnusium bicolor TaxID=1586634 RepID=A0AAV8XTP3_9CUCU|nr:hypothetical protein NQ314_010068 [Rhamnusium bicolor]
MVKPTFFIIHLTFIALYGINCEKNCDDLGVLLYEDLGCRAIKKDGQDCPIKYECDDFTRNKDYCLFRGRNYEVYQQIDNNITYEACNVGCFCNNATTER